jgi:hypothetical protein
MPQQKDCAPIHHYENFATNIFVNHYNSYKREVAWFLSLIAFWTTFRSDNINFIFVEMMLVSNNKQEKLNNE